jgi:hypothetical protein
VFLGVEDGVAADGAGGGVGHFAKYVVARFLTLLVSTFGAESPAFKMHGISFAWSPSAETLLRAVAADVGLGRAIELLLGERARVRAFLRG